MANLPCLFITKQATVADPALEPGARGARKHVVTSLFDKREEEATRAAWLPPAEGEKCPVIVAPAWEMASFTETTAQDRHYHLRGTEIYSVLSGTMQIEVDGDLYLLDEGDTIVVNPGAVHEVLRESTFLARVITVDCGGGRRQVRRLALAAAKAHRATAVTRCGRFFGLSGDPLEMLAQWRAAIRGGETTTYQTEPRGSVPPAPAIQLERKPEGWAGALSFDRVYLW